MSTPITELPDGSGCFTATVMSKEEAMKLPLNKRPLCYRISSEIYHAVFEAVGAASMCWKPRPGAEVFNAEEASKVAVDLCFKIAAELESKMPDTQRMDWLCQCTAGQWESLNNVRLAHSNGYLREAVDVMIRKHPHPEA